MTGNPPTIRVFSSADCGRCPAAIDVATDVADDTDAEVEVVDIETDRGEALRAGVLSVPTTVVGDEHIRGVPDSDRLERALEIASN